ncbi:MAG: helix-turn-helix domain-containing protein [Halobacteria archaeon]
MPGNRPAREAISATVQLFRDAGFETSRPCDAESSSFELAARRKEDLVLLKFRTNAGEIEKSESAEMRGLSRRLGGSPLVVAERSGKEFLRPGVVYRRRGILSVARETLAQYLAEESPPLAFAGPGGLYVRIDGPSLGRARIARGLSLGDVASRLGVSRRTVQKYEREGMAATVEKALMLEEFLQAEVVRPQSLLERDLSPEPPPRPLTDRRLLRFQNLGFEVHPATRAPFDAVLQTGGGDADEEAGGRTLLVGLGSPNAATYRRARITASISAVVKTASAFFVQGGAEAAGSESRETVFMDPAELESAEDARDLLVRIEEQKSG